jgi:hypothetical protein
MMMRLRAIAIATAVILYGCSLVSASCAKDPNTVRLREFVNQTFIHGVPYTQAQEFRSDRDVEALVCWLNDPEEQPHWRNIATVLGMSGNPHASRPLIRFVETGDGSLSKDIFAAKSAALLALGYLAPKDREVMSYLKASTDPSVWDNRGVQWSAPYGLSTEERDTDLSKYAILALGVSGQPAAAEFLTSLKRGEPVRLSSDFNDVIVEALRTNENVQRTGVAAYEKR